MISRENRVQLAGLALGVLVFVVFALVMPQPPGLAWLAAFLLAFYGVSLIGPQLYLYRQGEAGEMPESARARFLITLAIVLPLWTGSVFFRDVTIGNVSLQIALGTLSLVVLLVYFVNEIRHGYVDFAEEADLR